MSAWIDYRKQGSKGEWSSVPVDASGFCDGAYDVFDAYVNACGEDNPLYAEWETKVLAWDGESTVTVAGITWELKHAERDNFGCLIAD